ncbi:MAG TPA: hypothetical protein VHX38_15165 [Pseudonocardiaceae bacterium]|jgi:hypothetical protein|nr:hypothetical protein [Pseudonocardiaceae bacterium]
MRDIPCNLGGYTLMVTEAPEMKTRKDDDGKDVIVTDRDTKETMFVVSVFAKQPAINGRKFKGEEIKITLEADPGDVAEGTYVELIDARVSPYSFKNDSNQTVAGISFRAHGLKPRV